MGILYACPCCPKDEQQNREPLLKHGQSYSSILSSIGNVGPAGIIKENSSDSFTENRARSSYGRVFGIPLTSLQHDGSLIPVIVERMIAAIEETGIHAEGLYRKSGLVMDVKELIKVCNEDLDSVDFTDQHIHVLATVFKTFFRDLPEPLLCYTLYDEFLEAAMHPDEEERMQRISEVRRKMPRQNVRLLERLMSHLAKVAEQPENRMTANSLAIIFAPNILQPLQQPAPDKAISNVGKQTTCIQCLIEEQIKKSHKDNENETIDDNEEDR